MRMPTAGLQGLTLRRSAFSEEETTAALTTIPAGPVSPQALELVYLDSRRQPTLALAGFYQPTPS